MQLSSNTFNEVIDYLEGHEESLRIKKLIFCICKKYWENDNTILNSVSLTELIQELIHLKPSNDQLTFSVYKLVKTLNRTAVYAPLGKTIIDQVSRLYSSQKNKEEETQIIAPTPEANSPKNNSENLLDKIAANLANHREESRIKKLMFAACKNRWENNLDVINAYGLKQIILELHQNHPNKIQLRDTFKRIVEVINKKNVYWAIAGFIFNQLDQLYEAEIDSEQETISKFETKIIETQIIHRDETQINYPENIKQEYNQPVPRPISNGEELTQIYSFPNPQPRREQDFATTIISPPEVPLAPAAHPPKRPQKDYDIFEIRLEIMQYTNPLKAKILLFSILFQPWDQSGQDWSTLRGYTLDDLLLEIIHSGKSIKEIEKKLHTVAKTQTDVESNLQTAGVILQAIGHIL